MKERLTLPVYTFSHFCVDFGCFYILYRFFAPLGGSVVSLCFLGYNIVAFGLQTLFGALCDARKGLPAGSIGILAVLLALVLSPFKWPTLVLCALGNALFHVGGGIDSIVNSSGRLARGGIFVSSGALGVVAGTFAGMKTISLFAAALPLIASLCFTVFVEIKTQRKYPSPCFNAARRGVGVGVLIFLALASIAVRSYVGFTVPMPWKTGALLWLAGGAAALGKAAGGLLADVLGARRVGVGALLISLPLFCFFYSNALLCALGIFFFNMTMAVSLATVSDALPHSPGLAFGLTTLALLVGNVPIFFFALNARADIILAALLTLLSAFCIFVTVQERRKTHGNS